jgi:transcriptional antiterminator RfaH
MTSLSRPDWFVVRTKPHKELLAYNELRRQAVETFLPLLKAPLPVFGRMAWVRTALFPCYMFARFTHDTVHKVKNTRGVREIVSSSDEFSAVPEHVVDDLMKRCVDGVIELPAKRFEANQRVKVTSGVFRGWDAVFERYLSASERVAILLHAVEATGVRVVLSAQSIDKG